MVGSAIVRRLASEDAEIVVADRKTLDLTSQQATEDWLAKTKPSAGFLAAGLFGRSMQTAPTLLNSSLTIWLSR